MEKVKAELTKDELATVGIMRMNQAEKKREVRKEWHIGKLRVVYHWRSASNLWGRFGGGWNWKIGAQAGGRTLIVDVLVFSMQFDWSKP